MTKKISVIIPMYNERPIIENTARTLFGYLSGHSTPPECYNKINYSYIENM